jgi:adenine phosphoribosyltransferase
VATIPTAMRKLIFDVPDHPKPGIVFKDITPLLAHPSLFRSAISLMAHPWGHKKVTHVVAMEARGFMVGAPLAHALDAGFVPARKPGKLPRETHKRSYALEYGHDGLEIHRGVIGKGDRVVIADDLLATGGTALAVAEMVEETGATLLGFSFLITLLDLPGLEKLRHLYGQHHVHTVLTY